MPQSVGRKLTTSRERTVRIRKVVGSIPIRSTTKSREIINFTAFLQLFCKNDGPVAQPFPPCFPYQPPLRSHPLFRKLKTIIVFCSPPLGKGRKDLEMNDSHPSILYKTVRIPFVQYFQYLRRKHLSGIYPALENLYFVLEQHLNMIISKDIHPLNPLTQNHLPDRELRFQRFVVQLLQFRMGIHMTF